MDKIPVSITNFVRLLKIWNWCCVDDLNSRIKIFTSGMIIITTQYKTGIHQPYGKIYACVTNNIRMVTISHTATYILVALIPQAMGMVKQL